MSGNHQEKSQEISESNFTSHSNLVQAMQLPILSILILFLTVFPHIIDANLKIQVWERTFLMYSLSYLPIATKGIV